MTSVVTGMVGGGFYDRNSAPQWAAADLPLSWLESALAERSFKDVAPAVGIADFGCSEGRNSLAAMRRVIGALRTTSKRPIQTLFVDLPTNDFGRLLAALRPDGRSAFDDPAVYSAAVGGDMFDPLLPRNSVHVATTFNSVGYLSRRPVERLSNHVIANGPFLPDAKGSVSDAERAIFTDQLDDDMRRFYRARAAELVPGGRLLMQCFGAKDGLWAGACTYDALNDALLEAIDMGIIDRDSYERYYSPVYYRTVEQLTELVSGPQAELGSLFRLDRAEDYEVPMPFEQDFKRTGDVATYARAGVNYFRAFTEAMIRQALSGHPNLDRLIDHAFARVEQAMTDDPERFRIRFISIAALLTRLDPI